MVERSISNGIIIEKARYIANIPSSVKNIGAFHIIINVSESAVTLTMSSPAHAISSAAAPTVRA